MFWRLSIFLVLLPVVLSLVSCGDKEKSSEMTTVEAEIEAQWTRIKDALIKKDVVKFKSLCSEEVQDLAEQILKDYVEESGEVMIGTYATDYEIGSFEFNKETTEATVILKGKWKKYFIKEDDKWLMKTL